MPNRLPSRYRGLAFAVIAASGLVACTAEPQQAVGTACHALPGVLDFPVGGRGPNLPPPQHHGCSPNSGPILHS